MIPLEETVYLGDIPIAILKGQILENSQGMYAGVAHPIYYVHPDHLGTPRRVTQPSTNALAWRWDSDPFGNGNPDSNPGHGPAVFGYSLRFPGQTAYADSYNAYYNLHRDYDPTTGRYLESDPIGLAGGINTYAYVGGNPVSRRDPRGLSPQDVANAWSWLQQNYPNLTNSVSSVSPVAWLDYSNASGIANLLTSKIYIRKSYYTNSCLSDTQKSELLETLAHEALHIYLDDQIGILNYLQYNSRVGYHDWITNTAAAISSYNDSGVAGASLPSINTYPDVPFNPND